MKTLKDKRKELLNRVENEEFNDTMSSTRDEKIFHLIELQDKQAIKDLIEVRIKRTLYPKYLMLTKEDLDKIMGVWEE